MTPLAQYVLRIADDHLILGQRLSEWTGKAPTLEEELSMANLALDCLGQTRGLLSLASQLIGDTDEDRLAFLRLEPEYVHVQLVELPNDDFAVAIARQLYFSCFMLPLWTSLTSSKEASLAAIADQSRKETAYHVRYAREWALRLGDGTDESHQRMQAAVDDLWPYTGELFESDGITAQMVEQGIGPDPSSLRGPWDDMVGSTLRQASLTVPEDRSWFHTGGRSGVHTEHLGHLLAEMQFMQRAYPDMKW
ncbi:MAG: 1,2-phenylacetyl-CoA epoxidase subunit PaaC [Myxococcota bacterium]